MRTSLKMMTLLTPRGGGLLPFTDDFARADGDVGNGWEYTPGIWTISGNAVSSAPTLGAEIFANGNCETGDPPTGYSSQNSSVLSAAADERTGGAGSQSLNVKRGTADAAFLYSVPMTAKRFYKRSQWWKVTTATGISCEMGFSSWGDSAAQAPDWTYHAGVGYSNTGSTNVSCYLHGAGGEARLDDFSLKMLTTSHLFMTRDFGTPNVKVSVDVTITEHAPAGIVLCLDDQADPQNYILVLVVPYQYFSASLKPLVYVHKFVAGVRKQVGQPSWTYVAGSTISAEFANTTLRVYANGVQIGTDYTISDAKIIGNTRHGLFDGGGGSMEDFAIE